MLERHPAGAVTEKYEISMVWKACASGKIFDGGYKYIFGTLPKAPFYPRRPSRPRPG